MFRGIVSFTKYNEPNYPFLMVRGQNSAKHSNAHLTFTLKAMTLRSMLKSFPESDWTYIFAYTGMCTEESFAYLEL